MIAYLLKSAICMAILLGVFYVALEREKMHKFNRFYLLFCLCFSLCIPFLEVETEIAQVAYTPPLAHMDMVEAAPSPAVIAPASPQHFEIPFLLLAYLIPTMLLLARLVWHLFSFWLKIKRNSHASLDGATVVLLDESSRLNEAILPYTFFHYIFVGKSDFYSDRLEKELYTHELLHARQRHTLDILFVELLIVFLWFNPLVYLFRRAIKQNHEFLADEFVVKSHSNVYDYQNILLSKVVLSNHQILASNLLFSLTKKRLTMMTKNVSLARIRAKQVVTIPVFVAIALFLCVKVVAQSSVSQKKEMKATPVNTKTETDSIRKLKAYYFKDAGLIKRINGKSVKIPYAELSEAEKETFWAPKPPKMKVPTETQMTEWLDSTKYGLWIDGKRTRSNSALKKYKASDIGHYWVSYLYKNARKGKNYRYQLDVETVPYFKKQEKEFWEKVRLSQLQ